MKKWPLLFVVIAMLVAACGGDETVIQEDEAVAEVETGPTSTPLLSAADAVAPTPSGITLQPRLADANINMDEVVALLPPDAIPAILPDRVPSILVSAEEANSLGMNPDVRVIGISVNGESHAYPLPYLSRHEIVNVDIGGENLAVTW